MQYYGMQGYLATITDADEAQICGELSPGTGWIGGSDQDAEGIWKWMTGPESGTVFWSGGPNGSAPAGIYSNWNPGEPNNSGNNEDYAHITDPSVGPSGSWNDLPNATNPQSPQYYANGFLVEYGGMPGDPDLSISATTNFFKAEILSTTPSTSCEDEIANLQATANTTNILWFENQFGGAVLASGNVFNPVLIADTTFWVLASSNGCEAGLRVPVNATVIANETPVFEPIEPQCYGASIPLPTTDINGINGSWTPAFDPTTTATYNFTPDAGQCAVNVEIIIEIIQPILPDFNQIDDVCEGTEVWPGGSPLPVLSNNGIIGVWTPVFDSYNTTTYTFEPDDGQCASTTEMTIVIIPLNNPNFTQIEDQCAGTEVTLPTTSIEGINGSWSPAFDSNTSTTYTFTPDDGQCANIAQMTVEVIQTIDPQFTQIENQCAGTEVILPTTSIEGINGSWSPAFDSNTSTTYTFTPDDGQCANITQMSIGIVSSIIPVFDPIAAICAGESLSPLPNTSINGIEGSWNPPNIDNTQTTTYTFLPSVGECIQTETLTITVLQETIPSFEISDICIGENIGPLPTVSNEGISGSWSPAPNNLITTTYTFTPDDGQCAALTTTTVEVNPINFLEIAVENISQPFDSNQMIAVNVNGGSGNYEYQLDEGNWQSISIFQNIVGCEQHNVKVRDFEGCSNTAQASINILDYPKFFTPNGDGYNDFWNILCLENQTAIVSIFNRHGKLLRTIKTTNPGWNGTYKGSMMPANDYWFLVTYFDENGIEKQFRSHFSLRR